VTRRLVVVGLLVAAWAAVAIPVRATYGARVTADEPQYLLTALGLVEDVDLDIADEIRERAYEPFHEPTIDPQTEPNEDGREFSPHDPLLPLVLAIPMGLGGWVAAKATLALLAGALASLLVWVAVERFGVGRRGATVVVLAFALCAPLTSYGTQVYPEVPAALAVTAAIAALTGAFARRGQAVLVAAVVALPWLSVKYAPVAVALVGIGGWLLWGRGDRPAIVRNLTVLAAMGVAYLVVHHLIWGGWTVYASGDHFQQSGEFAVTGSSPDYASRTQRLLGLLVDRGFGLAAWAPVYLVAVPALGALARRRPPWWPVLALPLAAGWANATWVALTMHGWWWPGRQTVVVLPCVVLAVAWWVQTLAPVVRERALRVVATLGAVGVLFWGWLVVDVLQDRRRLIIDFESTTNPLYRAWRRVLPDLRLDDASAPFLYAAWLVVVAGLAWWGWRSAGGSARGDEDPGAGERADADRPAVDVQREGAVG
jgi:hypothetical protein